MKTIVGTFLLILSLPAIGLLQVDGPFMRNGEKKPYWDVCHSIERRVKCSYFSHDPYSPYGAVEFELPNVPNNLIQGGKTSCAEFEGGIDCWGPHIFRFPGNRFTNISQIKMARKGKESRMCVLDSGSVVCVNPRGEETPIPFQYPVQEIIGDGSTLCLRNDSSYKCLNENLGKEWEFTAPDLAVSDNSRPGCFISGARHLCYDVSAGKLIPQLMDGQGQNFRKVFGQYEDKTCALDGNVLKCRNGVSPSFIVYEDVLDVEADSYYGGIILTSKKEVLQFHNKDQGSTPRVEPLNTGMTDPVLLPTAEYGGTCIQGKEGTACFKNEMTSHGEYFVSVKAPLSSTGKIKGTFYFNELCSFTESNDISCLGAHPFVLPLWFGKGDHVAIETRYSDSVYALWRAEGSKVGRWDLRKGVWKEVRLPSPPQSLSPFEAYCPGFGPCSISASSFSGNRQTWMSGSEGDAAEFSMREKEYAWLSPKLMDLKEKHFLESPSKDVLFAWDLRGPLYYQIENRAPVFLGRPLHVLERSRGICASFPSQVICWDIFSGSVKQETYPVGEFSGNFDFDKLGNLFYEKDGKILIFVNQPCEYQFKDASASCNLEGRSLVTRNESFSSAWKRTIVDAPNSEKGFLLGIEEILNELGEGMDAVHFRMAHFVSFGDIGVASGAWQSTLAKFVGRAETELKNNNITNLSDVPLSLNLAKASLKLTALSFLANENLMEPQLRSRVKEMGQAFQKEAASVKSVAEAKSFAKLNEPSSEVLLKERDPFFFFRPRNESVRTLLKYLTH